MKATISEYRRGITSLHHLMDMFYLALIEVMPSAVLGRVGASWWRGYVIRSYKNLARGQYFCQIYSGEPTVFLMEEFCNYRGKMFYPWRVDFDLLQTDFFENDAEGQKRVLVDFYAEAVREALEWQDSEKRRTIVPQKIWGGKNYKNSPQLDLPQKFYRVSPSYITALNQQNQLFELLKGVIETQAAAYGMAKPYLKYSTAGRSYRGLWMKLRTDEPEDAVPEGSYPYHFKIDLYDRPDVLRYLGEGEEKILDLAGHFYFGLDENNQKAALTGFLRPILEQIKLSNA